MRGIALGILVLGLMASPLMDAQSGGKNDNRRQEASAQGVNLAGQVSKDGKTLTAADDNVWSVSNAGKLQGYEGRNVTVKCRTDLDRRTIHVLSVVEPSQGYYTNNLKDSAFRK